MKRKIILSLLVLSGILLLQVFLGCSSTTQTKKETAIKKKKGFPVLKQIPLEELDLSKNPRYSCFKDFAQPGPIIPGITEESVPQGLGYLKSKGWLLISSYMHNGYPSNITAVDVRDGKLKKTVWLAEKGGIPFTGHVGGICISKKFIWIASGNGIHGVRIEDFINAPDNSQIEFTRFFQTEVRASFATYSNDIVWVGEFSYYPDGFASKYTTKKSHHLKAPDGKNQYGWAVGYKLSPDTDLPISEEPQYILSIMDKVQGMAFYNGYILFSTSYGRQNNSRLFIAKDPMKQKPDKIIKLGSGSTAKGVPLWFIHSGNIVEKVVCPSMMEGITIVNDSVNVRLAMIFESGANKYRSGGMWPLDKMYYFDIARFLKAK